MQTVEVRQIFFGELGGCHKLHKEIYITINSKVVDNIIRKLKRPQTITWMDTTSRYDRIVHSVDI